MNPEYFEVEIGGKTLTVFYPQFEKDGEWEVISEENHLPVVLKGHDDYIELLDYLNVYEEMTANKLEELADLIEQMSLLAKGPKGDPFVYEDFTQEQLDDLKGEKGDPFVYEDFTQAQLDDLKGEKGDTGPVNTQAQEDINNHKNDTSNPHNVTKSQVGLGSVSNYNIATKSQAEAGTVNNRYMTPLRTKEAIDSITKPEVTNTPYGKCVKHPDGTLEHFGFDVVMDRHISTSYKRADIEFSIPFIDDNYYVSSSIVMGLAKNPLPYTRTKGTNSVEMAVRSISADFEEGDEVSIDLHAVGRWK